MKISIDGTELEAVVVPNTTEGYEIVYMSTSHLDARKVQLRTGPVIAWAIYAYDETWNAEPIGMRSFGGNAVGLKHPDGRISEVGTWGVEAAPFGCFVFAPCSVQESGRILCDEHCPDGYISSVDALAEHLTKQRDFELATKSSR